MKSIFSGEAPTHSNSLAVRTTRIPVPAAAVKILIVDDQPANLLVLEAVLQNLGHTLVKARSGEEALKCVLQDDFAVILLDVLMPGMDGFETAGIIRERDRSRYTPIIFITAIGMSETHVSRGYAAGAVDYLFKPLVPEILKAKVAAFVDLYLKSVMIAEQSEQLRILEQLKYQADLEEAKRQLEAEKAHQDARAARKVQQLLFPHAPPACAAFEIAGASYPADATGGDYFDYIPAAGGALDVVIGDVSGHGFPAALLMSATRAYLRGLVLARTNIDEVLSLANRALAADMEGNHFVTLLYTRLNSDGRSLVYSSAGHPDGYVITSTGEVKLTLQSTSLPLGILADGDFHSADEVALESGDVIFLCTDGLTEATSPDGTFFGAERALQVLRENLRKSASELVESLHFAVEDFVQQPHLKDDITFIIIKVI